MARIDDAAIRDIRDRASLFDVVSDVVALRRRGRSAMGLCPFHGEKTPSFTVSEERGFYHCFGCGEHGDVFSFVMKTQALAFPEAVRWVAQRFGLPVPENVAGASRRSEPLAAATAAAQAFFRSALRGPQGARARAYLDERGITADSIERFGLGWAPGGDALARHLRTQDVQIDDAVTAGLVLRRESGGLLDRFRERVIFPILDLTGKVVAFGGRILPGAVGPGGDPPPKYLNSPESPLFHKGRTLYGLGLAREAIRTKGRVVVVEGYLDVIALAQAGIGEVVAPLGTALTADQLRVVRRFSEQIVACFDGDPAGRRAAARSFPVFIEAGLWGRGVFLPAGEDPDTFVRTQGAKALEEMIGAAVPLVDAYLDELAGPRRDAVARRADAAREVARVLRSVDNPLERDVLARLAADRLGVGEEALRAEARAAKAGTTKPGQAPAGRTAPPSSPARPTTTARRNDRAAAAEIELIELLVLDPALGDAVRDSGIVAEFEDAELRAVAERLLAADVDQTAVLDELPTPLRDRIARKLLADEQEIDREAALRDYVRVIRERRRRRQTGHLLEELRAADAQGRVLPETTHAMQQHLTEKTRT